MIRLSQKFEFSASHRLHNPGLSDEQNRRTLRQVQQPPRPRPQLRGPGHPRGRPDDNGLLIDVPPSSGSSPTTVIDRFDHKNLNVEVPEFRDLIPTVENIAMVIYRLLKPKLADAERAAGVRHGLGNAQDLVRVRRVTWESRPSFGLLFHDPLWEHFSVEP